MDGMIIGMMKRRIEKYQEIVKTLRGKQELTEEQEAFLEKGKSMKLYIDTNVIIDMIDDRKNEFGDPLGIHAAKLFTEAIKCKYHLIISDWTFIELSKHKQPESVKMLFELVKKKIITQKVTEEDKEQAQKRSPEHPDDAFHVILAEKADADIIVTSNTTHFNQIPTKIPIKKPKYL